MTKRSQQGFLKFLKTWAHDDDHDGDDEHNDDDDAALSCF